MSANLFIYLLLRWVAELFPIRIGRRFMAPYLRTEGYHIQVKEIVPDPKTGCVHHWLVHLRLEPSNIPRVSELTENSRTCFRCRRSLSQGGWS